jgi:hypothetical protein
MTNGKTAHLNAIVSPVPFLDPSLVPGPEMFQIPGVGGVNGNVMAIPDQPLGDLLEVVLRATHEGIVSRNDVEYVHLAIISLP